MSQPVCLECKKSITRRATEPMQRYAQRKFCGMACSRVGQRAVRKHFKISFAAPTDAQIREFYAL